MKQNKSKTNRLRVTHFGTAHIGNDIAYDCAVLEDGRRGYILSTLQPAIGIRRKYRLTSFEAFCAEISPNALKCLDKHGSYLEVTMPHGGTAIWVEAGFLSDLVADIIRAAALGKLRKNRRHLIEPCLAIQKALIQHGQQIKMAFPL